MSGSKRPVWLVVAVVFGLAVVAYLALRPQPSVLPAPPCPAHCRGTGRPLAVKPTAVVSAPANVTRRFRPPAAHIDIRPGRLGDGRQQSLAYTFDQCRTGAAAEPAARGKADRRYRRRIAADDCARHHAGRYPNTFCGRLICATARSAGRFPLRGIYVSPAVAGKYVFIRSEVG